MNKIGKFHNTIGLSDTELREAEESCAQKDFVVLEVFNDNPKDEFIRYDVISILEKSVRYPVVPSSVTRSLNTLEGMGYLKKTTKRMGPYDRANWQYKLNSDARK